MGWSLPYAVGAAGSQTHLPVRGHLRVADRARRSKRGGDVLAGGVAHVRRDRGPGRRRRRDRNAMWAVGKNPADLSADQRTSLASFQVTNKTLYRAYLLKEQLREVFRVKGKEGRQLLAGWLPGASHSRIPEFVKLAATIGHYRGLILNTLDHGLSNARSESTNTHLRALTKRAYGFHSPEALIGMAMLTRGDLCPPLPGRAA